MLVLSPVSDIWPKQKTIAGRKSLRATGLTDDLEFIFRLLPTQLCPLDSVYREQAIRFHRGIVAVAGVGLSRLC
jgi:hypothetical protein